MLWQLFLHRWSVTQFIFFYFRCFISNLLIFFYFRCFISNLFTFIVNFDVFIKLYFLNIKNRFFIIFLFKFDWNRNLREMSFLNFLNSLSKRTFLSAGNWWKKEFVIMRLHLGRVIIVTFWWYLQAINLILFLNLLKRLDGVVVWNRSVYIIIIILISSKADPFACQNSAVSYRFLHSGLINFQILGLYERVKTLRHPL